MRAVAELLEEHERRLRILSGHIIPERCKPHEGPDVLSRTTEWDEGPVPAIPGEGLYDGLSQEIARHALTGEPYERERSEVEVTRLRDQVDVLEARNARLVAASGTWNVERASLCARLERAESGKHPPVPKDDLTAAYMAGAASRRHDVAQGEEEQQGTAEPCHGDLPAVDSGSPPDDAVDADSDPAHASSPAASSLHNQIEVALDRWGDNLSDERSQAEVVYPVLDAWEARHRKLYEAAQAMCEEAPTLHKQVGAALEHWVDDLADCRNQEEVIFPLIDAFEAKHRKLREAAQTVVDEVPHQIQLLREQGFDGHATGLERAAARLKDALEENGDA